MVKHTKGVDLDGVIKELKSKIIKVGYFPNAVHVDGTPVALIAATHEHGSVTENIPPRPTLNPALEKNRTKNIESLQRGFNKAVDGKISIDDVLQQIADNSKIDVVREIGALTDPPLSPYTIAQRQARSKKISTKPLIDTGLMQNSVEAVVEDK